MQLIKWSVFGIFGAGLVFLSISMTESKNPVHDVIIVGAGVAGLAAGQELKQSKLDVLILEARDRIGGRLNSVKLDADTTIDLGASWIHGAKRNPITKIAQSQNIKTAATDMDDEIYLDTQGKEIEIADKVWDDFIDYAEEQPGKPFSDVLTSYTKAKKISEQEKQYLSFLLNITVENEVGAPSNRISYNSFDNDEEFKGDQLVFPNGYSQIADALAKGLKIELNNFVTNVDYRGKQIIVSTSAGKKFYAKKVIVTVPLGILKAQKVTFTPSLPNKKQAAINQLGMGTLNKVFLLFDKVYWPENQLLGYIGDKAGAWSETLNLAKLYNKPLILMFNGADYGEKLESKTDAEIINEARAALSKMTKTEIPAPKAYAITRWHSDKYTYGAYSYLPAGLSSSSYDDLADPVAGKLFFAGEATNDSYPATVHGAYLSGIRAAKEVQE